MESGWFTWSLKSSIFLILISCTPTKKVEKQIHTKNITHGTLVCRLGRGFFSDYFRQYASKEQKYSHIGIVSKEKDSFFVYHAEASELTGVGFVKKESLITFLEGIKVYQFFHFDYNTRLIDSIVNKAKEYHHKKTPFDLDFNSFDDTELYCSELIATCINKTLKKPEIKPTIKYKNHKLYGLDDIYLNKHVKKMN